MIATRRLFKVFLKSYMTKAISIKANMRAGIVHYASLFGLSDNSKTISAQTVAEKSR